VLLASLQLLLLAVGVLYALFGGLSEAATAFGVILLAATAEVHTEWRAKKAVTALASSAPKHARVRREGRVSDIGRSEVVPGDVVVLKAGDVSPTCLSSYYVLENFSCEDFTQESAAEI
jgi:Ca2+-transporting ATPase